VDELWSLSEGDEVFSGEMELADAVAYIRSVHRSALRPVPARYRTPRVGLDEAAAVAEDYLSARGSERYPSLTFDPPVYRYQNAMCFTFFAFCPDWVAEGRVPGALTCSVDKVDGHIWTDAEFDRFEAIYESLNEADPNGEE
jgi:hypothetical protein